MKIGKTGISGLMILDKISDSTFRLVMTSELGPKLLDLEMSPDGYKVNYAYPKLKRKKVLQSFYDDFSCVCGLQTWGEKPIAHDSLSTIEYSFPLKRKVKISYIFDKLSMKCSSAVIQKKSRILTRFYYFRQTDTGEINKIFIEHTNFPLSIHLKKIE
ncbi:MAG: hypothetical protein HXX13_03675 [Bacteroidetes bacterium]|nr:hypothetical protein [Bacteroidota bacterium]